MMSTQEQTVKYQCVLLSLHSQTSLDSASQNDSSFHVPGTVGHDTIRDPPVCLHSGRPTSATSGPQHGSTSESAGTTEDSTAEELPTPDVGKTPSQPKKVKFPKRSFGKTKTVYRSFQAAWFDRWSWLHYDASHDKTFCHVCVTACKQNLIASSVLERAFITRGFTNWKDATASKMGFTSHDRSDCHKEAVERLLTLPANTRDVGEQLSAEHEEKKATNRKNLVKVRSNLRFLARQGLSMRGHEDENDSNIIKLCGIRGEDDPRLMA